ncbi:hypothetical protein A9Q83_16365 [Alphaproteobacteria bacterium 46_93_T64]|nr:hypothetical protein A9Q83_16365 [Alphaproteobacteria bacterium 46_93_T64]
MTASQAKRLEHGIIVLSILSMAFIFQPFYMWLFPIGCIGVVFSGLIFNLVPFCVAGTSYRKLLRVLSIVAIVFVIVVVLALIAAWAYGIYLTNQ